MNTLSYKPNLKEVQTRLRSLYTREAGDCIFATMAVPNTAIAQFAQTHAHGECEYPDLAERICFWDDFYRERTAVDDDAMPAAYLSEFDQGLYGGLLGAKVRFMADPATGWISSMIPPLLADWSDFDRLCFDPEHPWWRRYLRQLEMFVDASQARGVSAISSSSTRLTSFELIEPHGHTQSDEHPRWLAAIDFAYDLNVRVHETF